MENPAHFKPTAPNEPGEWEFRFVLTRDAEEVLTFHAVVTVPPYVTIDVPDFGKVSAGRVKVEDTPKGTPRMVLWATPVSSNCRDICWQQWANVQTFWIDGGQEREIANGKTFPAPGGRHEFGKFGRDLPEGSSDRNCFRLDDIPGVPGAKGIVDAPHFPVDAQVANSLFENAKDGIRDLTGRAAVLPFTILFRFTMRSIIWCVDPGWKVIGYYSWQSSQRWDFTSADQVTVSDIEIDETPKWTSGTTGLPSDLQRHKD